MTKKPTYKVGDTVIGNGWLTGKEYIGTVMSFCEGAPAVRVEGVPQVVHLSPETVHLIPGVPK